MKFPEIEETHCEGYISIDTSNLPKGKDLLNADVGIQIAHDGRLWVCVNGISLLRFKPSQKGYNKVNL